MTKKRILFLCYWSMHDSLTAATVFPRLLMLQQLEVVKEVVLVTIEREGQSDLELELSEMVKVKHVPLQSRNHVLHLFNKINDFLLFPKQLIQLTKEHQIDVVLAHGSPAGALAYKICKKLKLPFYVSSFEPHADYMQESGVWPKAGLKYFFQKRWEQQQKKSATCLLPVTSGYKAQLISEGVAPEKIIVEPCGVDISLFHFSIEERKRVRQELNIPSAAIVGIYAGKYGGMYYKDEAFEIYRRCFEYFSNFYLLILTPDPVAPILARLEKYGIARSKVYVAKVPHHQVSRYLSAADFAFATYKPGPSKKYLSPVKTGEYWANGLPFLLTEGIGDDSNIIKREGGGALFNLTQKGSLERALGQIKSILQEPSHRKSIPELAKKYRSFDKLQDTYRYLLGGEGTA